MVLCKKGRKNICIKRSFSAVDGYNHRENTCRTGGEEAVVHGGEIKAKSERGKLMFELKEMNLHKFRLFPSMLNMK